MPKKLNDNTFCKYYEIRINLLDILKLLVRILYHFYKDKTNKKFGEYRVSITNVMSEYYQSGLFNKLSKDVIDPECSETVQTKIFEIFNLLSNFDFLITDQYLIYDKHILELSYLYIYNLIIYDYIMSFKFIIII